MRSAHSTSTQWPNDVALSLMIRFVLGVEDLADTRFAISPLQEALFSLWALRDPGRHALHIPWRRSVLGELDALDTRLLLSLVGESSALPDFLTPRPTTFAPTVEEQLIAVRDTSVDLVRRDLLATHAGSQLPDVLHEVAAPEAAPVLEADMTYRARQLAAGGARLLFADLHPNLRWQDGVLHIDKMIGEHCVAASGRGLLLVPSLFAYKPIPPLSPKEPPWLAYPSRGVATLWAQAPEADVTALASLLGAPRARMLRLLGEPLPTVEIARRLRVTPSAVSQHLQVLHATGLVARARDGRYMLYRRSPLGDQLTHS